MPDVNKRLLNEFQRDLPLSVTPYADIAVELGITEAEVIERLRTLIDAGTISRVGPVFRPRHLGASSLMAMAVPPSRLQEVADLVNSFAEVNHNYEREHKFNLWFVVVAETGERLQQIVHTIERETGIRVVSLPMLAEYHIDLGFALRWD